MLDFNEFLLFFLFFDAAEITSSDSFACLCPEEGCSFPTDELMAFHLSELNVLNMIMVSMQLHL